MAEPTVFGFNQDDAKKLIASIGGVADGTTGKNDMIPDDGARFFIGITTSTITARSGTTVGSGTATVKRIDSTTLADHPASAISLTVYNICSSSVASGVYVGFEREYASGKWIVMLEDCGE